MEIFITRDGQQHGPYTLEQAQAYVQQGQLLATDLAWREGLSEWVPLSQILGSAPATAPGAPPPPPATASINENTLAMLAHLLPILTGFLGPLVIWLVKKDDSQACFVTAQAKESLNFQITVAIALLASVILTFVVIGGVLMPIIILANVVLCIVAALKANDGVAYRYPVALRLIK